MAFMPPATVGTTLQRVISFQALANLHWNAMPTFEAFWSRRAARLDRFLQAHAVVDEVDQPEGGGEVLGRPADPVIATLPSRRATGGSR
jgi:hypothetical protein